jgi:hypothetical protein
MQQQLFVVQLQSAALHLALLVAAATAAALVPFEL